jgi:hypothetical protein
LFLGILGEQIARLIIKKFIKPKHITQIDWMVKDKNDWYIVEVKCKKVYKDCHTLSINQVKTRMELYNDKKIKCLILCIDTKTRNVYIQWLHILEKSDWTDTLKTNTRHYNIKHFKNMGTYDNITQLTLEDIVLKYNNFDFLHQQEH